MQSDDIKELAAALSKAQGEISGAEKGAENPHFKSRYADLASVWNACREPLAKNGLSVVQQPRAYNDQLRLVTQVIHSSGQWIEDEGFPLILTKQDMQGLGSAVTYARRYGLMSAVGIAPEDDDGNAASVKVGAGKPGEAVKARSKAAPKEHGEMRGPLGITALKDKVKEFAGELDGCGDENELVALLNAKADIVDQCMRDLPGWYWTKEDSDIIGLSDRIEDKRTSLREADEYSGRIE